MLKSEIISVVITPELAQEFLKKQVLNKDLNKKRLISYCSDIENDKWISNTAEPIKFNSKGELIDGQTRLNAIIKTGKSIEMHIANNCDDNTQFVIDVGRRSLKDYMKLSNIENSKYVATISEGLASYIISKLNGSNPRLTFKNGATGKTDKNSIMTTQYMLQFYNENKLAIDYVINVIHPIIYDKLNTVTAFTKNYLLKFSAILKYEGINEETIEIFMQNIATGIGEMPNSIILARNKMINTRQKRLPTKAIEQELLFRCWNKFRNKDNTEYRLTGNIPELEL